MVLPAFPRAVTYSPVPCRVTPTATTTPVAFHTFPITTVYCDGRATHCVRTRTTFTGLVFTAGQVGGWRRNVAVAFWRRNGAACACCCCCRRLPLPTFTAFLRLPFYLSLWFSSPVTLLPLPPTVQPPTATPAVSRHTYSPLTFSSSFQRNGAYTAWYWYGHFTYNAAVWTRPIPPPTACRPPPPFACPTPTFYIHLFSRGLDVDRCSRFNAAHFLRGWRCIYRVR